VKKCSECGKKFTPGSNNQLVCSLECRQIRNARTQRERRKERTEAVKVPAPKVRRGKCTCGRVGTLNRWGLCRSCWSRKSSAVADWPGQKL
jgi:hypothetical protein